MTELIYQANPWALPLLMLVVLGLAIELPYRYLRSRADKLANADGFSVVQAGLVTLASFVLGLSFSQASARFDARRALVVTEANAIGTTWLRADQLDSVEAKRFRAILTRYTAARLRAYESPNNPALRQAGIDESDHDQAEMWSIASSALHRDRTNLGYSLLMQTLNDTIDVSAEQLQALTTHVPAEVIMLTLVLVTLATMSLGLGFAVKPSRPVALSIIYVLASVVVINMMIDYDRAQTGFIKVNLAPLHRQLQSMQ